MEARRVDGNLYSAEPSAQKSVQTEKTALRFIDKLLGHSEVHLNVRRRNESTRRRVASFGETGIPLSQDRFSFIC